MRRKQMRRRSRPLQGRPGLGTVPSGTTVAKRSPGHLYRLRGIEEWLVDGPGCYLTPDANATGRRRLGRTAGGHR
jgi:hypothetical protein